jgi:hypothetical protein
VKPKFKLKVQTPYETDVQATVIDWAHGYGHKLDGIDMLFSIPNGALLGSRPHKCTNCGVWCNGDYNHFALAAKLKKEGLKEGVSDLFLSVARHGFHGFYLETKRRTRGRLSDEQESFGIRAQEEGYKFAVYENYAHAIKLIEEYLKC